MKQYSILVVGDLMIDHYVMGKCNRISPEAPVQVVEVNSEKYILGGAGNVVNNLLSLGANVSIASVIGKDENGVWLEEKLKNKNINLILAKENRPTTKKSRIIASHQQIVRVDKEEKKDISNQSIENILSQIQTQIQKFDVIILSDYAKGVLTKELSQKIIKLAKSHNIPVFVDPKKDYEKYEGATLITPNKKEASEATNISIENEESLLKAGKLLREKYKLNKVLITLSEEGMAIFEDELSKIPTVAKEVYDVTGAGDTVIATLSYFYAKTKDIKISAHYANIAAGIVVGKLGSATTTLEEIEEYENKIEYVSSHKLKTFDEIEEIAQTTDKKIVFTNGCFDILHIGHVSYLQKAKKLGDILIVGVNSDESVKRLKGESRPINSEFDRAYLLASLECVDYVVIFKEDTPYKLIKRVTPDILVKGKDYEGKEVVGSDIAKSVQLIDFINGKSTTNIIKRIKND